MYYCSIEAWSIPSMAFAIICRSCRGGVCIIVVEKPGVYHPWPLLLYVGAVGIGYVFL